MNQHVNQQNNQWQEEAEQARAVSRRTKKRVLVAIAVCMGVLVLLAGTVLWLESIAGGDTPTDETNDPTYFYPSDPSVDIMEDADYLELDRRIHFTRDGEMTIVNDENVESYGPAVQTLSQMIDCIIAGDHEGYNALFSSNYYATEGNEAKDAFTMQRVYDVALEYVRESTQTDKKTGKTYTQYEIIVKYKISRNDGTFRRDIGSNEARKQYYVLSDSTSTNVLIDQIINYNYSQAKG